MTEPTAPLIQVASPQSQTTPVPQKKLNRVTRRILSCIFLLLALGVLALPVIQVWLPFVPDPEDPAYTYYTILRWLGLTLYSLIFLQIMSGGFRRPLNKFLHPLWHHRWHVIVGFLTIAVALAHPAFLYLSNKLIYGSYMYLDNGSRFNTGLLLGYLQEALIFSGFAAAILMNFFKRWMSFWRKIHWLMYLAFFSATVHSYILGSDINTGWYSIVRWCMVALVSLAVIWRVYEYNVLHKGRT